jgi:hypothetical protein
MYPNGLSMHSQRKSGGYSSNAFASSALEGSVCVAPHSGRFTHWKDTVTIVKEVGWALEPVSRSMENHTPHRESIPGLSTPY